ncbi:hypothetical protein CYMTET_49325 [Cymbomonas tetramitiformis]|uniref:Gem-associated protein 5 TPR domain-containing protein n=1 Tax=Cymbomonas tetramitiformis TaxID=36881 RepID=A0AAE0BRN2_9CHLO|nr:hypothetical protein CYMTET_49325 [Cymbomonas tetramitiformis]
MVLAACTGLAMARPSAHRAKGEEPDGVGEEGRLWGQQASWRRGGILPGHKTLLAEPAGAEPSPKLMKLCVKLAQAETGDSSASTLGADLGLGGAAGALEALRGQMHAASSSAEGAMKAASPQQDATRCAALALWQGDVGLALSLLQRADALSAEFVALSAQAGRDVWTAVTRAYATRLEERGDFQLASLHWLAVHDPRRAVKTLQRGRLVRDALALAATRLPPNDPLVQELRIHVATDEERRGAYESAAASYLSAGCPSEAIHALGRRQTPASLQAAAHVACASRITTPAARHAVLRSAFEQAAKGAWQVANDELAEWASIGPEAADAVLPVRMVLEAERALSWAVLRWDEAKAPGSATDEASPAAAAAALLNEGEAYAAMEAYADMACSHQAVFSLLEELLDSSGRVAEDSGGSPRTSACSPRGPVSAGDTTAAQRVRQLVGCLYATWRRSCRHLSQQAGVEDWKVRLGEVQAALRELDLMSPRGSKLRRLRLAAVLLDAVGWLLAGRPRLAAEGVLLGLAACEAEGAYSDLRAITLLLPSRPSPPLPGCREVSDGGPQPCGDDGSDEAAANKAWAALEALHAWGQLQGTWCERMARQTTQPGSASRSGAGASAHMPGCPGQRRERSTKLTLRQVEERVLASAPARLHALHTFQELMEPLLRVTRHGLKSVSALASTPVLEENKETSASPARPPATPTRAEELRPGTDTPKAEAEAEAEGMIDLSLPAAGSPQPRAPVTSLEADRGQAVGGGEVGDIHHPGWDDASTGGGMAERSLTREGGDVPGEARARPRAERILDVGWNAAALRRGGALLPAPAPDGSSRPSHWQEFPELWGGGGAARSWFPAPEVWIRLAQYGGGWHRQPGGADVAEALRQLDSCLDLPHGEREAQGHLGRLLAGRVTAIHQAIRHLEAEGYALWPNPLEAAALLVAVHGLEQNEEDEARSAYVAEWGLRHSFLPPQQALFTRLGATAPPSITPEPAEAASEPGGGHGSEDAPPVLSVSLEVAADDARTTTGECKVTCVIQHSGCGGAIPKPDFAAEPREAAQDARSLSSCTDSEPQQCGSVQQTPPEASGAEEGNARAAAKPVAETAPQPPPANTCSAVHGVRVLLEVRPEDGGAAAVIKVLLHARRQYEKEVLTALQPPPSSMRCPLDLEIWKHLQDHICAEHEGNLPQQFGRRRGKGRGRGNTMRANSKGGDTG